MLAIILKRETYRENDLRVVLYTEHNGKMSLIARGAKKSTSKMRSHLEPLNLIHFNIVLGKKINYIASAYSVYCFSRIKNDLVKSLLAQKFQSLIHKKTKELMQDRLIFCLVFFYLKTINNAKKITKTMAKLYIVSFYINFINILGEENHDNVIKKNMNYFLKKLDKEYFDNLISNKELMSDLELMYRKIK